jgi:RNA polymerase sigma-70 factor (ECF subfamily)
MPGCSMSVPASQSDDLLAAAKSGDQGALAALLQQHRERLERIVKLRIDRRLQGRVDPADVVQETTVAVLRKFAEYAANPKLSFFLWLRLETLQKLIDVHRFHLGTKMRSAGQEVSLHRGSLPQVNSVSLAEQLLGRLSTASRVAMRAELKLKVEDALNQMDANDREMLVLRHFEELSNAEAAEVLELSVTAACNRYVRALKRLKSVFAEMPGGLEGLWP